MKFVATAILALNLWGLSVHAKDNGPTRELTLEVREVYTFRQAKNKLIQQKKVVEGEVVIRELGKKNKKLFSEEINLIDESENVVITLEPRNTVRFVDKELGINRTVKGRFGVDFFGSIDRLTLSSSRMKYINQSSLIKLVNTYLDKTKMLYGFFSHHVERSDFNCEATKENLLVCTHYVGYYVEADGNNTFGKF